MHPAEELKQRTKQFADNVIKLCQGLPRTQQAQRIGGQLQDAGTSVGANYRASCCARSRREFISKVSQAYEEADECCYWLGLLASAGIVSGEKIAALQKEADELTRILAASRRTAQRHERARSRNKDQSTIDQSPISND